MEWVCPKCGTNEEISEINLTWVEYRGKFNNEGLIEMFPDETPLLKDNPDDPQVHYVCGPCGELFYDPITKEDYEKGEKIVTFIDEG
jgi:hypothetical protein